MGRTCGLHFISVCGLCVYVFIWKYRKRRGRSHIDDIHDHFFSLFMINLYGNFKMVQVIL